jgi:dTDP-4-dehydrorhamnose reductase
MTKADVRWIVTGSHGQLGRCLVRRLGADAGVESVVACTRLQADLADPVMLDARIEEWKLGEGDVLANAAAYTAVDACESDLAGAQAVNALGPERLARACERAGARFVHVSTDYVFDGHGRRPYTEDDPTGPRTAYGRTKLDGERRVLAACPGALVVRTSWVFGPGRNFVGAILRQARLRQTGEVAGPLRVVDDQRGCPTSADDLARGIQELVAAGASGLVHLCNAGDTTWWDFARAILDETGHGDLEIERARTADLALPAPRPAWSVLDCSRAADLGVELRSWREALVDYLAGADAPAEAQP